MENFDPRRVIADVTRRLKSQKPFSAQATSNNRPAPQAAAPSVDELMQGAEKLKVKDMNNAPEKKLVLEKTNKPNDGDWLVISLKQDGPVVEKEKALYRGCRIHNQIFGCFKGLGRSGRRRFQERS